MSKTVDEFDPMAAFKDAMIIAITDLTLGVGLKDQKIHGHTIKSANCNDRGYIRIGHSS